MLRERWEALQFERLGGPYRRYREVLAASLGAWCDERGHRCGPEDGEALARSMESWQPFPDTVPALRAARAAGLRLWIISNTDRAIMEHTLRQLEVEFDGVTVAEDVRAYKPARPPFEAALEQIGEPPERVLHVAFGFKYDIATAAASWACGPHGSTEGARSDPARRCPTESGPTSGPWHTWAEAAAEGIAAQLAP